MGGSRAVSLVFPGVAIASALAFATFASAKEGASARLSERLPLDAPAGQTLTVNWTVTVADQGGGRVPFNALGMFVRLLSRTGAAATTGFASATAHTTGHYVASVAVPTGGIGAVRLGLRGTTDIFFPIANDPFTSATGVRCDVAVLRRSLDQFVGAYNHGDGQRLNTLFSRPSFLWYSSGAPGVRIGADATNRATLIPYFKHRHSRGDRLSSLRFQFNGFDFSRVIGNFQFSVLRRASDFHRGRWLYVVGKGGLDCSQAPVTILGISLGQAH
ncbi:MAG TPA: hypothetical protein VK821_02550 [Dehalococcoidia bacterium]|nr:hypothetical protein [Dehalococcoidia bacterium]